MYFRKELWGIILHRFLLFIFQKAFKNDTLQYLELEFKKMSHFTPTSIFHTVKNYFKNTIKIINMLSNSALCAQRCNVACLCINTD